MKHARARFVGYSALSLALSFAGVSAALGGSIVLALGAWPLTRMETLLTLLIVVGTLLTPSLLAFRWLRKHVWSDTARVVEVLGSMRRAVNAGMFTYGICALAWLFIDDVLVHFVDTRIATGSGLHWPGTALFLLLSSAFVSAATWWQGWLGRVGGWIDRAERGRAQSVRRFVVGPVLTGACVLLAALTLSVGTAWRYNDSLAPTELALETPTGEPATEPIALAEEPPPPAREALAGAATGSAPAQPAPSETAPAETTPAAASTTDAPLSLASREELSAALAGGEEALVALLERFPSDPKVLRAVAVNQASRSSTLVQSAQTFKRLFEVAPSAAQESDLQNMVVQMTRSKDAGKLAYALLGESMGSIGPDLLYKLSLTHKNQRDEALRVLGKPSVRKNFSPELLIAYELRFSQSCSGRLPLMQRAEQFGDDRSIRLLRSLARTPTRCPKRPCKPTCPSEAERFLQVIDTISKRLAATGK